jgi:hypothetical protein
MTKMSAMMAQLRQLQEYFTTRKLPHKRLKGDNIALSLQLYVAFFISSRKIALYCSTKEQ